MLQPITLTTFFNRRELRLHSYWPAVLLTLTLFSPASYAQGGFNSGSDGSDGAFNPTANVTVPLPESGVFNFTTVNIPANVTVRFSKNTRNTPVMILASGTVTIAGFIDVSGSDSSSVVGGPGGPGGFNGGNGGFPTGSSSLVSPGSNGDGPGGGGGGGVAGAPTTVGAPGGGGFGNSGQGGLLTQNQVGAGFTVLNSPGGARYGLPTLLPLIGGSGGGGEVGRTAAGGGGGGGGGALLIASSGTIDFTQNGATHIVARGGMGSSQVFGRAGGGSGGAVRLIANILTGVLRIDVSGTAGGFGGDGAGGYIRIEAFDLNNLTLTLTGPSFGVPRVSITTPKPVTAQNLPTIRIVSVAGIAPPTLPNGSLQGGPDIVLPGTQPNPVAVALTAANIPLGTTLQVILTPENGARVVTQSSALTGTVAASNASASVTVPDGICVIQASGTVDVSPNAPAIVINGERVKRIEVEAVFGGKETVTYITTSNKRIRVGQ